GKRPNPDKAEDKRKQADFLATKRRQGAMDGVDGGGAETHVCANRRAVQNGQICGYEGGEESATPRKRTQPLVRRPDCLRHSSLPQRFGGGVRHAVFPRIS